MTGPLLQPWGTIRERRGYSRRSSCRTRHLRRVTRGVVKALNDNFIVRHAIKYQVGIRADIYAPNADPARCMPSIRMLQQQKRDGLNLRTNAGGTLRGLFRDIVQCLIDLLGCSLGETQFHRGCFAQMACICSSVANSPLAISASASARSSSPPSTGSKLDPRRSIGRSRGQDRPEPPGAAFARFQRPDREAWS